MEFTYDVAVIGGGVAGICAAIAAAKGGAKTVLIERNAVVGGMSTSGFVNVWCGRTGHQFFKDICSEETLKKGKRMAFSTERLKVYYLDRLQEAGVDLLLHCSFVDAEVENGKILSATIRSKGGNISKVTAKVFVDATGDGDVSATLGAEYCLGRESDHLCEPVTLLFLVDGVDESCAVHPTIGTHPDLEAKLRKYVNPDEPVGHVIILPGHIPGTSYVNITNLCGIDATNPLDLTRAELITRRQVPQILKFLQECVPGYANCRLMSTAECVGVRESRHIVCDYMLSEFDLIAGKVFEDWVVRDAYYHFGAHNLTGSGGDPGNILPEGKVQPYTIPLRSLIVSGFENLLVAGRCIGGTHRAHSSYRVMPICMATGDGAGAAAAFAAKNGGNVRTVDIGAVQKYIKAELLYSDTE